MQKNTAPARAGRLTTHEGGQAMRTNAESMLKRSVMSCFLWEKEFYEDGVEITDRIASLVKEVKPAVVAQIALEARENMKLRHAPLFIVREMARHTSHRPYVADALAKVIQRGDELAEFMAMYWADGRQPIAHSVRRGLASAIEKFDEYALAKYDRDKTVKLRDVLRMVRPNPKNQEQAELWGRAVKGQLATPDTWEVALSAKDGLTKKAKWERLLSENKLGALALIRNLRNMEQEGVERGLVEKALLSSNVGRVLPFRFIAAARYAPRWEEQLEKMLFKSVEGMKLPGKTAILVDISGSMRVALSSKSDMLRTDGACGVAMVGREMCESADIYSFTNKTVLVPARRGFGLRDAIMTSQPSGGTELGRAVSEAWRQSQPDRMIVITDEQSHDNVSYPAGLEKGYMINVASNRNGVGYGKWTHIDGFSEAVFSYILEAEKEKL